MLFHLTHTHAAKDCPAFDPERLKALAESVEKADSFGVHIHSLHVAAWEHTFYGVVEAETSEALERWTDVFLRLGTGHVTPVSDAMAAIARRREAAR